MNSLKTLKGTELPLLNLKGKDYLQVAHRLVWFREEHPEWLLSSSFVRLDDQTSICKAEIFDETGRLRAVAHKREDLKHFPDFMEKSETGAIGRALAMIGYGTQFAPDLDEGDRIVDSPIQRVSTACPQPTIDDGNTEPTHYKIPFGKFVQKTLEQVGPSDLRNYIDYLESKAKKDGQIITGKVAEFIALASDYVASFENSPLDTRVFG